MSRLPETFTWRGRRVRWERMGDGPPVVFCHGTPWSSDLWRPIATALSATCTTYLWDMPGYGRSSKDPDHAVSLDVQGELLADLLTEWGLDAPVVVAHDVGGAVALRAHLLHHAPYRALALVDVVALSPWGSPYFRLVREHTNVFLALPPAIHEGALRAYVAGAGHRPLTAEQVDGLVAPWLGEEGQAAFYRQVAQADERDTEDLLDLLPTLDLPVLVAWGTEDTWIPVDRAHRLAGLVPGAELRLVEGAGHLVQLDQPEALSVALTQWLGAWPA